MNCLIVLNGLSGNACKVNLNEIKEKHTAKNDDTVIKVIEDDSFVWDVAGFNKVIVCGGDGTLYNALNECENSTVEELVYIACGTFNETFHTEHDSENFLIGKINRRSFSYVCAVGSFCEIGYRTDRRKKQRLKVFAYIKDVLKFYKVHKIAATIKIDGKTFFDDYTLVMAIHSQRCFGFNFNKMHEKHPEKLFLLTVKSFGEDNLKNRFKLFFPLFRIFFLGLKKPVNNDRIFFDAFEKCKIDFDEKQTATVDGEKLEDCKKMDLSLEKPKFKLIIDKEYLC